MIADKAERLGNEIAQHKLEFDRWFDKVKINLEALALEVSTAFCAHTQQASISLVIRAP